MAFKKTFSYTGFEMQPKKYESPKIALLNAELELKIDNVEVDLQYGMEKTVLNICFRAIFIYHILFLRSTRMWWMLIEWAILYDKLVELRYM